MLFKSQRSNASITAGFLDTNRNNQTTDALGRTAAWFTSLFQRFVARRRKAELHRQTMTAMAKLNSQMLSDVGWPGRYEPEANRDDTIR